MSIIDGLVNGADFIKQLLGGNYTLLISDLASYKFYAPGTVDFGFKIGNNLIPGTLMHKAIQEKRKIVQKVERQNSKFGFPYIGIAIPIIEGNQIVGALALAQDTELQNKIIDMSGGLAATSQELSAVIENLASGSEELANVTQNISLDAQAIQSNIENTDSILNVINRITNSTNMLGLNAAIEAARAGESGRGFAVVAEEIRKLALNTKESQMDIQNNLKNIKETVLKLNQEIEKIAALSEEQAASTEQTSASIQELSMTANNLSMIADELVSGI
ncbi:methyl-accepting chemotaxis protein [Desulfosporosinus acidiphilus SJ4]|uniref:Methyl-accepting chemotaxis protein n=1 Tax=Desulfosporosinus acidiphilus (strain DSM 22704 / JCM 16185 / SJ4) TaxID=646529 RepID=I4D3A9_DESAJ|nr:methyl-accepting chemotaxis protein [Desulfosporosinus acidiphilus]AFM40283.1 methyl-accepting chemotaxis protein [Desulfosporosinus acidiphilus SJ4]